MPVQGGKGPRPPPPSAASALPAASSGGGEGKEAWGEVEVGLVAAARVGSLVLAETQSIVCHV